VAGGGFQATVSLRLRSFAVLLFLVRPLTSRRVEVSGPFRSFHPIDRFAKEPFICLALLLIVFSRLNERPIGVTASANCDQLPAAFYFHTRRRERDNLEA